MSRPRPWYNVRVYHRVWFLTLVLTGCDVVALVSGQSEDGHERLGTLGAYRDADTLVVGRTADALDLDPARASDNESAEVIAQLYDRLIHYKPGSNTLEPGLAVSWEVSDSNRSWTFELRRGVRFHDGTPLDADAVVTSFERQRDPRHRFHYPGFFYWQSQFGTVESVTKVDDYRVRITTERAYAPLLASMTIFSMGVVSPTALARHGEDITRHPVGTGPFKFVSWEGGRIVLERNDDYWGPPARVSRLVFETVPDARQRLVALESGAIDVALGVLPEEMQFVALHPSLRPLRSEANAVTYLAMNTMRAPFDDVRVRRAVNHAVNKNVLVEVLWHGLARPAESPVPPGQWGHHQVREPYAYDPARARELLAAARADGHFWPERTYRLHVPSTPRQYLPSPERLGRAIQANLEEVGMRVELVVQPFHDHVSAIESGQHDMCLYGWVGDTGDPDNFLYLLLGGDNANAASGQASNVAFFRDPEIDGLLTYAQEGEEERTRAQHYARVQELVHEFAPWVPLAHPSMGLAARGDVLDLLMGPSGLIEYRTVHRGDAGALRQPVHSAAPGTEASAEASEASAP